MKKKIIAISLVFVLMVSMFGFGFTMASTGNTNIQAVLSRTINIRHNSQPVTLRDTAGNEIFPIIFQGTTYLPLRAVAGLFDVEVNWDAATSTVLLGGGAPGMPTPPPAPTTRSLLTNGTWQGHGGGWRSLQGAANMPQPAGQTVAEAFNVDGVRTLQRTRTFELNEGITGSVIEFTSYFTGFPEGVYTVDFEIRNAANDRVLFTGHMPVDVFATQTIELHGATEIEFRARLLATRYGVTTVADSNGEVFLLAPTIR